jgi:hypothetical protein
MSEWLYCYAFAKGSPDVNDLLAEGWEIVCEYERHQSFLMRRERFPESPETEKAEDATPSV